jgi:hypothetical protein
VHGSRLLRAYINSAEELRKLWASPAAKDAPRRENRKVVEFVNSDIEVEFTSRGKAERYLIPEKSIVKSERIAFKRIVPGNQFWR